MSNSNVFLASRIGEADTICKDKSFHDAVNHISNIISHLESLTTAIDNISYANDKKSKVISDNCTDYNEAIFKLIDDLRGCEREFDRMGVYTMAEDITKQQ